MYNELWEVYSVQRKNTRGIGKPASERLVHSTTAPRNLFPFLLSFYVISIVLLASYGEPERFLLGIYNFSKYGVIFLLSKKISAYTRTNRQINSNNPIEFYSEVNLTGVINRDVITTNVG